MIRNILWNLDGAVFDTYPAVTYAFSKALNAMGKSVALNLIDGLARQSLDFCTVTLAERCDVEAGQLRRQFTEAYRLVPPAKQPLFPDVAAVCAFIYAHGGVNLALTELEANSARQLILVHGLDGLFEGLLAVGQGLDGKPVGEMIPDLLAQYALQPEETLLVTDRLPDIRAGCAAGVHTCLFGRLTGCSLAEISIERYRLLLDLLETSR